MTDHLVWIRRRESNELEAKNADLKRKIAATDERIAAVKARKLQEENEALEKDFGELEREGNTCSLEKFVIILHNTNTILRFRGTCKFSIVVSDVRCRCSKVRSRATAW